MLSAKLSACAVAVAGISSARVPTSEWLTAKARRRWTSPKRRPWRSCCRTKSTDKVWRSVGFSSSVHFLLYSGLSDVSGTALIKKCHQSELCWQHGVTGAVSAKRVCAKRAKECRLHEIELSWIRNLPYLFCLYVGPDAHLSALLTNLVSKTFISFL